MTHRFIGSEAEIGGVRLRRLGDSVTLTEKEAEEAIVGAGAGQGFAGAVAILPAELFDKIFTAEDVARYGDPGPRLHPSVEFGQKYKAALEALHELRVDYASDRAGAAEDNAKSKGGE